MIKNLIFPFLILNIYIFNYDLTLSEIKKYVYIKCFTFNLKYINITENNRKLTNKIFI